MEIKFYDRENAVISKESVYGQKGVELLYGTKIGKLLANGLAGSLVTKIYGSQQDTVNSKKKIKPFIKNFNINMDEYLPEDGRTNLDPYSTFNNFFIRRFKEEARTFEKEANLLPAPCEARYFGFESLKDEDTIPVKGRFWSPKALLNSEKWASEFEQGPALLARLCPVDYHRFHFPDDGEVLDSFRVSGKFHSVNPLALKANDKIFQENERQVSILETKNFGKLAYIEVGAMMVGKIVQTYEGNSFTRGQEKGYFLFGGSTVIVFGQKGLWKPDQDILEKTSDSMETYIKLGSSIASIN